VQSPSSALRNLHSGGPDALFAGKDNVINGIFERLESRTKNDLKDPGHHHHRKGHGHAIGFVFGVSRNKMGNHGGSDAAKEIAREISKVNLMGQLQSPNAPRRTRQRRIFGLRSSATVNRSMGSRHQRAGKLMPRTSHRNLSMNNPSSICHEQFAAACSTLFCQFSHGGDQRHHR
jgi:hypothetical protein